MTLGRTLSTAAAAIFTSAFIAGFAGPAAAQSLPVGDSTVSDATNTASDAADTVGDTVGGATDGATGTVDGATGAVDGATGTVDGAVDGATGGTGTGGTINDTVDGVTDAASGATSGTVDDATDTVNQTLGGSGPVEGPGNVVGGSGSSVVSHNEVVDGVLGEFLGNGNSLDSPTTGGGWIKAVKSLDSDDFRNPGLFAAIVSLLANDFAKAVTPSTGAVASFGSTTSGSEAAGNSFFESAGRAAVTAAKALAFPLALAVVVMGFLMVQGRIGRRDPKLALAPVDVDEESLTFE